VDFIFLRDFRTALYIGVHEWEKQAPQTIQLDLEIGLPHSRACHSDNVNDTIDYGRVVTRIEEVFAVQRFALVEAVAERVANILMDEFTSPWVKVSVTKLGLIRNVKQVGVTIERGTRE
jgi:dihydroneopterin aldolase